LLPLRIGESIIILNNNQCLGKQTDNKIMIYVKMGWNSSPSIEDLWYIFFLNKTETICNILDVQALFIFRE
jgi:hypothetical protein